MVGSRDESITFSGEAEVTPRSPARSRELLGRGKELDGLAESHSSWELRAVTNHHFALEDFSVLMKASNILLSCSN